MILKDIEYKIKNILYQLYKFFLYKYRFFRLKVAVFNNKNLKIILGAATTSQDGWYSTNEQWFDIRNARHWKKIFKHKDTISNLLSEHVFEHLTFKELETTLKLSNIYLKKGGKLRIAVPDGYNPHDEYIQNVKIEGIGADAQDHKQLLNYDILKKLLINNNFECFLLEGYKNNKLIINNFSDFDGYIMRTRKRDRKSKDSKWNFIDSNTSLIIDAIKK